MPVNEGGVRWLRRCGALVLLAVVGCTPVPRALDGGDDAARRDGDATPGLDAPRPPADGGGAPDADGASPPGDVLTPTVTPGRGSGASAALPRIAMPDPIAACTRLGALTIPDDTLDVRAWTGTGGYVANRTGAVATVDGVAYTLWVEFDGVPASWVGRRVDLGLGEQASYSTSTHSVLAGTGCRTVAAEYVCDHYFFQRAGVATYAMIASAAGQRLAVSLEGVVLGEVAIDRAMYLATPIPGGGCLTLDAYAFTTRPLAAPMPPPPTDGGSGGGGGFEEGGGRATAKPPVYHNDSCTSTNATCAAPAGDCVWQAASGRGVCASGCQYTTECPAGRVCVAFGGVGRCLVSCVGGTCADNHLACRPVTDSLGRGADVCLPPEWYGAPRCGDMACNGSENCVTCPSDCAPCRCGDGFCGPGENCDSCEPDCGACRCGDGVCTEVNHEDCVNCRADCGACDCRACGPGNSCAGGGVCLRRNCDFVLGCYASATANCDTIDGAGPCPRAGGYQPCTDDPECGDRAQCLAVGAVPDTRCREVCTTDADCLWIPAGFEANPRRCAITSTTSSTRWCSLTCASAGASCPYGATCRAYSDGTYGFCD